MTGAGGHAIGGYEAVEMPARAAAGLRVTAMLRRRSVLPSRRAVLHLRAAGDPAVPAGLAGWYTERAFHFYLAGLRLPGHAPVGARPGARYLAGAYADIDAACEHLRQADGIASIIVSAQGRGALAAALWCDARAAGADALILHAPELPAGISLALDIDCPVLVLAGPPGEEPVPPRPGRRRWPLAPRRAGARRAAGYAAGRAATGRAGVERADRAGASEPADRAGASEPADRADASEPADCDGSSGPADRAGAGARHAADRGGLQLGGHVTWLRLPSGTGEAPAPQAVHHGHQEHHTEQRGYFDELGRWLGAYMYGPVRDQLL